MDFEWGGAKLESKATRKSEVVTTTQVLWQMTVSECPAMLGGQLRFQVLEQCHSAI